MKPTDPLFKWFSTALVAGILMLPALRAQAAPKLLDDFTGPSPAYTTTVTGTNSDQTRDFTPTVPGGVRENTYNLYSNPSSSSVDVSIGDGSVAVSAGPGALGELLLAYGAFTRPIPEDPTIGGPLLGLDLSAYNAIQFNFISVGKPLNINYVLYTSDPGAGLYYNSAGINVGPSSPSAALSVTIPFAASAFNFSKVDGVFLEIDRSGSSVGNAYELDSVRFVTASVPEPQTWALLLAGGLAMVVVMRRMGGR